MAVGSDDGISRTFRVGLWAQTGMYFPRHFPEDAPLVLQGFPTEVGDIDITFATNRTYPDGFTAPTPFGVLVNVEGPSETLGEAVELFGNTARGLAALLSVVANAAIGEPTAYIAVETTKNSSSREFWSQNLESGDWQMGPGKPVSPHWFPPMVVAFVNHADRDRFHRAIVQYHHALQEWEPGNEIAALNHIWIGMESLTRLVRTRLEQEHGVDSQALARQYLPNENPGPDGKINLNKLSAEIRLRHLFQGDAETHKWAKSASDGYEHAYDPLWKVRSDAVRALEASSRYLRSAIFEYSGLDQSAKELLMQEYLSHPHTNMVGLGFQGDLIGSPEQLDLIEDYPDIELLNEPFQRGVDPSGDALVGYRFGIRAEGLPPGVRFSPSEPEIVALPGTVRGTEVIVSQYIDGLAERESGIPWEGNLIGGRETVSVKSTGVFSEPVITNTLEAVSFDSEFEYRVVRITSDSGSIDRNESMKMLSREQSHLESDGWQVLCIISADSDGTINLVCRRSSSGNQPSSLEE